MRCPPGLLDDVADLLDEVRGWDGVVERAAGVFYLWRQPFLHFHLTAGGGRRADVKGRAGWIPMELLRPISARRRNDFRRALRRHYAERGDSKSSGRSGRAQR